MASDDFSPYTIHPVPETGSKLVRANRWIARLAPPRHKIFVVRRPWCEKFLEYMGLFTGHKDPPPISDMVDAISLAYNVLAPTIDDTPEAEQIKREKRVEELYKVSPEIRRRRLFGGVNMSKGGYGML